MAKKRKTHQDKLLEYLKTHKEGITSFDAFRLHGNTRLAVSVHELKRKGYPIYSKTEYKNGTHYSRYFLGESETTESV